jgi:hypothetical protein
MGSRRSLRSRAAVPLVASGLLLSVSFGLAIEAPTTAMADPTAADKETARSLMTAGRAARDKGDLKGALKAFAGADAIMHVPTTGLEVAKAQAALGLLVEARDTALRVTRFPETPNEPAPYKDARNAASQVNDDVEARIPSLTVIVKGLPDGTTATVTIDGSPVPAELIGQPRKLDPGHHVVVGKAGDSGDKQEVDIAERESKDVTLTLQAGAAGATTEPTATETATAEQPPPPAGRSGASKAMIFGGFGLAGAGVIVGTITGIVSMTKTSSIKGTCTNNECPPADNSDIDSANMMATISTISFIAGGVGAVVGVLGLLTGKPSAQAEPAKDGARVEPWIGVGALGVKGRF